MRRGLPARALALAGAAAVFLCCGLIYVQGFDVGEDGFWLLAATEGGRLHQVMELGGPSGRIHLLRAAGLVFGESARTLAWLQAFLTALVGLWGGWLLWRRGLGIGAALFALAAVGLGPAPPWLLPPLAVAAAREASRERLAAAAWAGSAAFGLGSMALATPLLLLGPGARPSLRAMAVGIAAAAGILALTGAAAGSVASEWALGWSGALSSALSLWRGGSAWSWWESFVHGPLLWMPFAELKTGEALGARWPAHEALRQGAYRLLYLGVLAGALLFALRSLQRRRLSPLALCAALILSLRGDLIQLRPALLLAIPGWLLLFESPRARRWAIGAIGVVLLPLLAEKLWLLSHQYRSSLLLLDQPRAHILLERERVAELRQLSEALQEAGPPMLAWPNVAGLHVLTGIEPASRFVRQPTSDRSRAILAEFEARPPARVLLAQPSIRGQKALAWAQPELHEWLRLHYQLLGSFLGGVDRFRVLAPLPEGIRPQELSLPSRIPFAEMGVGTEPGPTLQPDLAVGQSFVIGSTDFAGFSLRWSTDRPDLTLPLRIHLWARHDGDEDYDLLLQFFDVDLEIPQSGHRSYLRIGPVPNTAGWDLALTFELREAIDAQVQPLWHRHDTGTERVDFYPPGTALLNDEPVAADLYFAAY